MNADSLRTIFETAASVAAAVPENLQPVAFEKAVDLLAQTNPPGELNERRKLPKIPKPSTPKATARKIGPQAVLNDLVAANYFSEKRATGAIQSHVKDTRGYDFASKDLSKGLLRLVRDGVLRRELNETGQYDYRRAQ